jgi:TolA-binding protein
MTALRCTRAWQAEAVEDGRLAHADVASFERHATTCSACAGELRALALLREVGVALPAQTSSDLERRRLRGELLRRANELALLAQRRRWPRITAAAGMACAAAAVLVALALPVAPTQRAPVVQPASAVPTFRITSSPGAEWQMLERSATLRLRARHGRLELGVDTLRAGQRFLVELPDGQVEVKGTRFSIDVADGRTREVRVHEGRVALRLRGHAPRMLRAGDAWSGEPAETPAAGATAPAGKATAAPVRAAAATAAAAPAREAVQRAPLPPAVESPQHAQTPPPPVGHPRRAGSGFGAAMSAFSAGDYGRAEPLFVAFERDHPGDPRVEDALFLRAVAHSRRGDLAASRAVAREYLERYPRGLRSVEAQRLAR